MPSIAQAMVELGDLDESMALARTIEKAGPRKKRSRTILESLADDNFKGVWYDPGGIKIVIGAEMMKVKDPAVAKQVLPRIAQEVRMSDDRLAQARLLSMIASLQANAGDFAGARADGRVRFPTSSERISPARATDFTMRSSRAFWR